MRQHGYGTAPESGATAVRTEADFRIQRVCACQAHSAICFARTPSTSRRQFAIRRRGVKLVISDADEGGRQITSRP
jgi:hypothetical protein